MNLAKALVVVEKELLELRLQRGLLLGIAGLPILLTAGAVALLYAMGAFPPSGGTMPPQILSDPAFAGMSELEAAQALGGKQFATLLLLMPLFIPSVIASYSVVGEKTSRTLEPLLATPIRTIELVVGKSLAALVPGVLFTGIAAAIFVGGLAVVAVSDRVFAAVVAPGWIVILLLGSPMLALTAIALTMLVSSRVNDPRSAQQIAGVLVLPVMALLLGQLAGVVLLGPEMAIVLSLLTGALAALALWAAVRLFQREAILTRWR